MTNYVLLFFMAVTVATVLILLRPPFVLQEHYPVVRAIAVFALLFVYMMGMTRDAGVDIENYRYGYEVDPEFIPDPGFQLLVRLCNALGIPFGLFLALIGLMSCWGVRRVSRYYGVEFLLLFLLFFVHLMVVRDFAALRSGLSVWVALIGLTSPSSARRWILYLAGISLHSSTAVFVVLFEFSRWVTALSPSAQKRLMTVAFLAIVALGMQIAGIVALVDERIEIYTGYDKVGYGRPVESYLGPLRSVLLVGIAWAMRGRWIEDPKIKTIFYVEVLSIAVFLGFWQVAIFAHRLSNAVSTLYPVLIAVLLTRSGVATRVAAAGETRMGLLARAAMLAVVLVLISRPGTIDILARVNDLGF